MGLKSDNKNMEIEELKDVNIGDIIYDQQLNFQV